MVTLKTTSDFASWRLRLVQFIFDYLAFIPWLFMGLSLERPSVNQLMKEASLKANGLTDFGKGSEFKELIEARLDDVWLPGSGRFAQFLAHKIIVGTLVRRLLVLQYLKDHPDAASIDLPRPVFVIGLGRTGSTYLHNLLHKDSHAVGYLRWQLSNPLDPDRPLSSIPKSDLGTLKDPRVAKTEGQRKFILKLRPELKSMHDVDTFEVDECWQGYLDPGFVSTLTGGPLIWPHWWKLLFGPSSTSSSSSSSSTSSSSSSLMSTHEYGHNNSAWGSYDVNKPATNNSNTSNQNNTNNNTATTSMKKRKTRASTPEMPPRRKSIRFVYENFKLVLKVLEHQRRNGLLGKGTDTSPKDYMILKFPQHTRFLDDIVQAFPNASFIFTHRDMCKALPSWCSLSRFGATHQTQRKIPLAQYYKSLLEESNTTLKFGLAARKSGLIAQRNLKAVDLRYTDLMRDPVATLQNSLVELGLPGLSKESRVRIRKFREQQRRVRKANNVNVRGGGSSSSSATKHGKEEGGASFETAVAARAAEVKVVHGYSLEEFGFTEEQIRGTFEWYEDEYIKEREVVRVFA